MSWLRLATLCLSSPKAQWLPSLSLWKAKSLPNDLQDPTRHSFQLLLWPHCLQQPSPLYASPTDLLPLSELNRNMPHSGPLYLFFPLLGMLSCLNPIWLTPSPPSDFYPNNAFIISYVKSWPYIYNPLSLSPCQLLPEPLSLPHVWHITLMCFVTYLCPLART